jgi:hypothetical protein
MGVNQFIAALSVLFVLLCGCKSEVNPQKRAGQGEPQPTVAAVKNDPGMIGVVRKTGFGINKSQPVGKALDDYRYFTKRAWQETDAKNGTIYVDFIGELDPKALAGDLKKEGVVARSVNVKFVVKTNGDCFVGMITLYDTTSAGKGYPLVVSNVDGVMNAIYANTEFPLQ